MVSVGGADWTLICVVYNQVCVALLAVARALVVVVEATLELLVLGAVGAVERALPGGLLPGTERGALQQELYSLCIRCRSGDRLAGDGERLLPTAIIVLMWRGDGRDSQHRSIQAAAHRYCLLALHPIKTVSKPI